ncbi:ATP-binding protein [Streptomyces sp. NPDC055078]
MEHIGLADRDEAMSSRLRPWAGAGYDGAPESIAAARHFTARFLTEVGTGLGEPVSAEVIEKAQLVVSELVTNACKYAPGPCLIDLEVVGDLLEITVWDTSPDLPVACPAEPARVGRHGLEIVLALSVGFDAGRRPVGKRITVGVPLVP